MRMCMRAWVRAQGVHVDKGVIHTLGATEWDGARVILLLRTAPDLRLIHCLFLECSM